MRSRTPNRHQRRKQGAADGRRQASSGSGKFLARVMREDLGGRLSPRALAFVKGSIHLFVEKVATFRALRDGFADGSAAVGIANTSLESHPTEAMMEARGQPCACHSGCAFCCILTPGGHGGPITRHEAERMFDALATLRGRPDGRQWHPHACAALDPESRLCRVYDHRPVVCRATASQDAVICEALSRDDTSQGRHERHPAFFMLHVVQEFSRRCLGVRAPTYDLSKFTAAVIGGADLETALRDSLHSGDMTKRISDDAVAAFSGAIR